jgi:acyl-CoA thioesterase I
VSPAVIFLGDSLTAGLGLARSQAMPALIGERLRAEGRELRVINAGRSGDTTAGGLARLTWYLRPELKVHALVIGLGSNDAMRGLSLERAEANLRAIARKTRQFDPQIKIFLFQMQTFPNMGTEFADEYREMFPRVATAEAIELLPFPLEGIAGDPDLNQPDGIHPNAEGTRRMADKVWKAMAPKL